jgi:hypothetical protein
MPRIPQYTTTVIRDRAVADTFNPQAIQYAGGLAGGAAELLQGASRMAMQYQRADEQTALNEAVISKQRQDMDFMDQVQKERIANPDNAAVDLEKQLKERDKELADKLPTPRAKRVFMDTAARINVQEYGQMKNWENTRKTQIYASRIEKSIEDNNILMLRAGREGLPIDDYLNNIDATTVAASGIFAPEKLQQINQSGRATGLSYYLQGVAEKNPAEAKRLLESKEFDDDLGADGLQKMYKVVDNQEKLLQAKQVTTIKQEATAIQNASNMGLSVEDDVIRSLADRAEKLGVTDMAQSLTQYADNQVKARDFAVKSSADELAQLREIAQDIQSGNLSRVPEYATLAKVFETKQKMMADGQGWEFYSAHGIVSEPQPMNLADPASVGVSVQQRRAEVERIQEIEGRPIPILTGAEIENLKGIYNTSRASEVGTVLAGVSGALNADERRILAQQLEKSKAPMLAAAMGQPMEVAEGIIAGSKLPNVVPDIDFNSNLNTTLAGYIYDAEAYTGATAAIKAYYKHLSLLEGAPDDTALDDKRMKRAVEEVMGRPEEVSVFGNPSKILTYRGEDGDFVRPAHIENVLENMTGDALKKSSGGNYPITSTGDWIDPAEIARKATFITTGDGRYIAEFGNLGMIMSQDGGPFEFDVREIEKHLNLPERRSVISKLYNAIAGDE